MAEIRTLKLNLLADIDQFQRGMRGAKGDVDNLGYKIGQFSKAAAQAFAVVAAAAGVMAIKIGKDSIEAASNLNESVAKTQVIFGAASAEIQAFSKTTARALGISQREALDAASTFATFGKAAGLSGKNLTSFSKDLTSLSSDFASFFNTNPQDAITAIGAALRGESEPIRKYGILLNDATLKAKALEMGLYDGTGALDQQARVLAAYRVILEQSTDAQGDFARTSEGLANQQRILNASWEDAKAGLGEALLPVAVKFVNYLNTTMIPIIKEVAEGFSGTDPYKGQGLSAKMYQVAKAMDDPSDANSVGASLRRVTDAFVDLIAALTAPNTNTGISTLDSIANSLETIATAINNVTTAVNFAKSWWGRGGSDQWAPTFNAPRKGMAMGGSVNAGQAYTVGELGREVFVPNTSGQIIPNNKLGGTTIVNLNGVIDGESARRTIEKLLQDSARRTGAINLLGATL
jgi:hypothetical protein